MDSKEDKYLKMTQDMRNMGASESVIREQLFKAGCGKFRAIKLIGKTRPKHRIRVKKPSTSSFSFLIEHSVLILLLVLIITFLVWGLTAPATFALGMPPVLFILISSLVFYGIITLFTNMYSMGLSAQTDKSSIIDFMNAFLLGLFYYFISSAYFIFIIIFMIPAALVILFVGYKMDFIRTFPIAFFIVLSALLLQMLLPQIVILLMELLGMFFGSLLPAV